MSVLWFFSDIRTPFLTALFQFFTLFGEEVVTISLICALYWCVNKEISYGIGISFFLSGLLVQGLKVGLRIERPWILDPAFQPVESAVGTATGFSFPSGHTQCAGALYGYLGFAVKKRPLRLLFFALPCLVALSRLYLGVHTPADVLASLALSLGMSLLAYLYTAGARSDAPILVTFGLLSVCVLVFAFVLSGVGIIEPGNVADCLKAAGGCLGCAAGFAWERRAIRFNVKTPRLWQQAVKLLAGLAVLLAIKSGIKAVLGDSLVVDTLRYCLIALWVTALYPLLIKKAFGQTA